MLNRHAERVADVIVIGAGIVGAACARELAVRGRDVLVLDAGLSGATNEGMGHLVSMDAGPEELALCAWSLDLWHELTPDLPPECAYRNCGTLWLARSEADRVAAESKQATLAAKGIDSQWLGAGELARREPMLRPDLAGALHVPSDSIVYAPAVARHWLLAGGSRLTCRQARVTRLDEGCVQINDGQWLAADRIVLASGLGANELLPGLGLYAKKGQLAITDRYPATIHHQLVELAYSQQAHATDAPSVAFNVQPRPTGQILIGSSRQFDALDRKVDKALLKRMLQRAQFFLPDLGKMTIIRSWIGFRPSTRDELPLIGAWPDQPGLWLALGHEGHGVTTATGTAHMLADLMSGQTPAIEPYPYRAERVVQGEQIT